MPTGANLPSVARVMELADSFGIDMNSEEATLYQGFMQGLINSSRRIDSLTEEKPEVKTHDIKKTITLEDLTNPNQK